MNSFLLCMTFGKPLYPSMTPLVGWKKHNQALGSHNIACSNQGQFFSYRSQGEFLSLFFTSVSAYVVLKTNYRSHTQKKDNKDLRGLANDAYVYREKLIIYYLNEWIAMEEIHLSTHTLFHNLSVSYLWTHSTPFFAHISQHGSPISAPCPPFL